MPPNPPSKAHGFAMRSMSLRNMQFSKSEKINSWPPPPAKSWGRPCNSNNTIVKSVSNSAIMYSYSSLGENYRFLSDKYDIWPINWTKSFSIVLRKFYDYVDKHVYSANEATLIRDLCIKLDSGDFSFFNIDELNEMVVLLCTA